MTEFYKSVWFWLVIIGVVLLIAGIVYYIVFTTNKANANSKTPTTVWVLVGLGALLLVLGIIFAIFDSTPAVVVTEPVAPVTKVTTQEQIRIPLEPMPMQMVPQVVASPPPAAPVLSRETTRYYEQPEVQTQVITRTTGTPTAPVMSNAVFEEPVNRTIYNTNIDPLTGRPVTTYAVSPTNVVRQRVPVQI